MLKIIGFFFEATYSNNSKNKFSGVPKKILNSFGAVSAEVASLMSKNTYKKMNIKKDNKLSQNITDLYSSTRSIICSKRISKNYLPFSHNLI